MEGNSSLEQDDYSIKSLPNRRIVHRHRRNMLRDYLSIGVPTYFFYISAMIQIGIALSKANLTMTEQQSNAIALAMTIFNCIGFSTVVGIMGGFEILGPNAYSRENFYLVGVYLHRSKIAGYFCAFSSILITWLFSDLLLSVIAVESVDVDTFNKFIIPYMLYIIPEVQRRGSYNFLNTIKKSSVAVYFIIITTIFHYFITILLTDILDYGVYGIAFAFPLTTTLSAFLMTVYIEVFSPVPECIFWINLECFSDMLDYFTFSFPNAVLHCSEFWAWEIICIIASKIGVTEYNSYMVLANIGESIFAGTVGLSTGMIVKVSNYIAKKNFTKIMIMVRITTICLSVYIVSVGIILHFQKTFIISLYTNEPKVYEIVSVYLYYLLAQQLIDVFSFMINSYMKALGMQDLASKICLFNSYFVQTSMIYFLGIYLEMGLKGILLGFICGTASALLCYLFFALRLNLKEMAEITSKRLDEAEEALNDEEEDDEEDEEDDEALSWNPSRR